MAQFPPSGTNAVSSLCSTRSSFPMEACLAELSYNAAGPQPQVGYGCESSCTHSAPMSGSIRRLLGSKWGRGQQEGSSKARGSEDG